MKRLINILCALLLASTMQAAFANVSAPTTCDLFNNCRVFSETAGTHSATAVFWATPSSPANTATDLYIEFINSSTFDVLVPTDILTGLFFTLKDAFGNPVTLTPVSATLGLSGDTSSNPANSSVVAGPAQLGTGYEYLSGINFQGASSGISAAGLGIFGQSNFGGPSTNLGGLDYGLLSKGDNTATGNGGVAGHGPYVLNAVQFHLTLPAHLNVAKVGVLTNVGFQYGTALTEPTFGGHSVPLPGTTSLILLGLVAFWSTRRMTRQQRQSLIAA